MAATKLPDGSVVMQPAGQRPYPVRTGPGSAVHKPATAQGGGPGANKGGRVGVISNQPGRLPASTDAYK